LGWFSTHYISPGGRITDEVSARIQKARLAFANLRHLWRRRDIRLSVKDRVYAATVRPVLLYGGTDRLSVIARIWWGSRMSNAEVRGRVLGKYGRPLEQLIDLHRLRWLGHVLRMSPGRLPRRAMFAEEDTEWKKAKGGQAKTWHEGMKTLTRKLGHIGPVRLPGWGPRDDRNRWLETLSDMAGCRKQWRSCISSISSQP
uniref:Endonuclease-reverse transcriptase n=1 Tax=Echinostoma caproni TaxID=27848 RepID=A0A183AZK2_9TREM